MKSYFNFLFLVLFFSILPLISAAGFSPTILNFNNFVDEEQCQSISLSSDSEEIVISDFWKENVRDEWKLSSMNYDAPDYGLKINYPEVLELNEREVEVCLTGSEKGEYHGAIVLRESQEGNSVLQFVIWLKVNIEEEKIEFIQSTSSGGSSGGSSSSSDKTVDEENNITKKEEILLENTTLLENNKENNFGITGNVINVEGNTTTMLFKVGIVLILFLAIFAIYKKRGKSNE